MKNLISSFEGRRLMPTRRAIEIMGKPWTEDQIFRSLLTLTENFMDLISTEDVSHEDLDSLRDKIYLSQENDHFIWSSYN